MRHKNYLISFLLLLSALTATAQTCPGPAVRTALINLQKSNIVNGTRWGQIGMTDTCGNQRYVTLDSITQVIVDSIQADTTLQRNWYTHNGVTTDLGRVAFVKRTAWWRTLDSLGFFRFTNRPDNFNGSQFTIYQDSITLDADTIIWKSSWHPEVQFNDLQADGTYFYADSLKWWMLGQFPDGPNISSNGTDKGFYYYPDDDGVMMINGDGSNGLFSQIVSRSNDAYMQITDIPGNIDARFQTDLGASFWYTYNALNPTYSQIVTNLLNQQNVIIHTNRLMGLDTNRNIITYLGLSNNASVGYNGRRAWGVRSYISEGEAPTEEFDWIMSYLPNDTAENAVSFYNRAYYWHNEHPTGTANTDTLLHFWAATGPNFEAGKDPGFMTLDQIRGSGVNWYNSNGTTTDNTRIADVLETATWRSDNVVQDGIVPFRFELAGGGANEPENMVWVFPNADSAVIQQADAEIIFFTNAFWLIKSDAATTVQADSFQYNPNLGGTAFKVGRYNVVTQNSDAAPTHKDAIEYNSITGTAQTELFLDGSAAVWGIPTNSVQNFKVHVSAICSAAGNGVGISTGEAFTGFYLGGIKRVTNTTALVGTVQNAATAQADAGMSTSVVTIDADDTDDSLRIRFTPPSTAGSTTVIQVTATIEITQSSY